MAQQKGGRLQLSVCDVHKKVTLSRDSLKGRGSGGSGGDWQEYELNTGGCLKNLQMESGG